MSKFSRGECHQKQIIHSAFLLDQKLHGKTARKLNWFEKSLQTLLNLLGALVGFCMLRLPNPDAAHIFNRLLTHYYSKRRPDPLNLSSRKNLESAKEILRFHQYKTNKRTALLILTSHPESSAAQSFLLGHIFFHASIISQELFPSARLKLIQAVDSFALDSLPLFLEATYAGLISTGHLAIDRLPAENNFLQTILFRRFSYHRAIFHILKQIQQRTVFCMALSGGVIHNARVFYIVKELAQKIYFFSKREQSKRWFEHKLISLLTQENPCGCMTGFLSDTEREQCRSLMQQEGLPQNTIEELTRELEEELKLPIPYRIRFLKIIFSRLSGSGVPLLLLFLKHSEQNEIVLDKPVLVNDFDPESNTLTVISKEDHSIVETRQKIQAFVRELVKPV